MGFDSAAQDSASYTLLLDVAWATLMDIADKHPPKYREDIYAIAITLYARKLKLRYSCACL